MALFTRLFKRLLGRSKKKNPDSPETSYLCLVPAPPAIPLSPEERAQSLRETAETLQRASEERKGASTQRLILAPLGQLRERMDLLDRPPPDQPSPTQPIAA